MTIKRHNRTRFTSGGLLLASHFVGAGSTFLLTRLNVVIGSHRASAVELEIRALGTLYPSLNEARGTIYRLAVAKPQGVAAANFGTLPTTAEFFSRANPIALGPGTFQIRASLAQQGSPSYVAISFEGEER